MLNSRELSDLLPQVADLAAKHISLCKAAGIDLLVTSTYRDHEAQAALYAQGRTAPGRRVTNARPGESFHQWRVAYDVVPLRGGKPVWGVTGPDGELWAQVGAFGEQLGLEWAGRWRRGRESPHFQYPQGRSIAEFQAAAEAGVPE